MTWQEKSDQMFSNHRAAMAMRIKDRLDTDDPEQRMAATITLTEMGMSTREIGAALGVHHTTIMRDVTRARVAGKLPPAQPRQRKGKEPKGPSFKRKDLGISWMDAIDMLARKSRSLLDIRKDARYPAKLDDLARTRGQVEEIIGMLNVVLADFDAATSAGTGSSPPSPPAEPSPSPNGSSPPQDQSRPW